MARYISHPSEPNKYSCSECSYGLEKGVSRQSVNSHFKREHMDPESESVKIVDGDDDLSSVNDSAKATAHADTPSIDIEPEWMTVGDSEEGEVTFTSLPAPAKGALKFFSQNREVPSGSKSLKAFYEKQGRMLTWFARGVLDPLMTMYGRGVMGERGKDFTIKRSKDEWKLFEGFATEWVEYREISIPVNPDLLMIGCVGAFYVPPLKAISSQRDPEKPSLWGRLKRRVATWRLRRLHQKQGVEHFERDNQ